MTTEYTIDQALEEAFNSDSYQQQQQEIEQLSQRLGDQANSFAAWKQQVSNNEQKIEDLKVQLATEIAGAFHVITGEQFEVRCLKTKMEQLQKQVGYCLRQVRAAYETDPESKYLRDIWQAISDLDSKFN